MKMAEEQPVFDDMPTRSEFETMLNIWVSSKRKLAEDTGLIENGTDVYFVQMLAENQFMRMALGHMFDVLEEKDGGLL